MEADILLCSYFGECLSPIRSYTLLKTSEVFTNSADKSKQRSSKDAIIDVGKNYRNIQLFTFRKKFAPSYSNLSNKPKTFHPLDEVFDVSLKYPRNRPIIFNFIGSNQISQVRGRRFDDRYNVQFIGPRRNPNFLKYEKTTRCIKYCNTSKNCSGDIFLFL